MTRADVKCVAVYLKDLSFQAFKYESDLGPGTAPETSVDYAVRCTDVQAQAKHPRISMELWVEINASQNTEKFYSLEVLQGGLFELAEPVSNNELDPDVWVNCAIQLFPFVRETVSAMVIRGGFPRLILYPPNFKQFSERFTKHAVFE